MKWRYPIGGRLVSRIEAGFKGAGSPLVRGQAAKGLCVSKPQRVGRWGLGRENSPILVQQGSMPFMRQPPRGMQREKCQRSPLPRCVEEKAEGFCITHTSCSRRKAIVWGNFG